MKIAPEKLGSAPFKQEYGLRYAYLAGAMVKGIASAELVINLGRAGYMGFYGAGGQPLETVAAAVLQIQAALGAEGAYGVNLLANLSQPEQEMRLVDLLLQLGVRNVEASAYLQITPALVKFRLSGLRADAQGRPVGAGRVIAKLSRLEVARLFLAPPPAAIVSQLLAAGQITADEAALAGRLPMASDLCAEADSGGHTDMGVMAVLLPSIVALRDQVQQQHGYRPAVRVGAGGGIGAPAAVASAFMLGADFIVTGSINQCTLEAGTSEAVKDMLQEMQPGDTSYAPAGDMFEFGSKVQVLKRGLLFPARANKLFDLWRQHGALEELDMALQRELQDKYFRRSFEEVYRETRDYYMATSAAVIARAEASPKARMALVFRWYFVHSMRLAREGLPEQRVDYQVHTGPALGAFNQWRHGTALESWRCRPVALVADTLLQGAAEYLQHRMQFFLH